MFQLIFRIKEGDVYPIVVFPHQKRGLKQDEILIFETSNSQEFEEKFKNICATCIRLHGDVTKHIG